MRNIILFIKMPLRHKRLIIEACVYLVWAALLVRLVPFKRWAHHLGNSQTDAPNHIDLVRLKQAARVSWAIQRVYPRLFWKSTCLMNATALQHMLARRQIPSTLHLGVLMDHESDERMKAHAWVSVNNAILIGAFGNEPYQPIARFHQAPTPTRAKSA